MNVIDESVNRNRLRHQRVVPNALYIVDDSLPLVADGQPLDILAGPGPRGQSPRQLTTTKVVFQPNCRQYTILSIAILDIH